VFLVVAVCAFAALTLSTVGGAFRNRRNRREAQLLARALEEIEALKRNQSDERQILDARLTRIEQTLDQLAVEMERVGEGQRFVARMLAPRSQNGQAPG
jgi:uncharacterized protein HemX